MPRSDGSIPKGLYLSDQGWRGTSYPGGRQSNTVINSERVESTQKRREKGRPIWNFARCCGSQTRAPLNRSNTSLPLRVGTPFPIEDSYSIEVFPLASSFNHRRGPSYILENPVRTFFFHCKMDRLDQLRDNQTGRRHLNAHDRLAAPGRFGFLDEFETNCFGPLQHNEAEFDCLASHQCIPVA